MSLPSPRVVPTTAPGVARFLAGDGVGVLTTLRRDGSPHVAPVRFTWDPDAGVVRVMTRRGAGKARNLAGAPGRAVMCQVDGFRWVTLEGTARLADDPAALAEGARRYTARYGTPPPAPEDLVVVELVVDRVRSINL